MGVATVISFLTSCVKRLELALRVDGGRVSSVGTYS